MSLYAVQTQARALTNTGSPAPSNVIAFDGTSLSVDYASYLAQHDVVYQAPPLQGSQATPLGDGDLGAMLWCPGHLKMQVQKSDLWDDPFVTSYADEIRTPSVWRQISAGSVTLQTQPALLSEPSRFEQRLSLYNGVATILADAPSGACQITAFVAATAGVLVVHYQDQTLRVAQRGIDVSLWRSANLFALGETVGILQALRDRRYAMIARVQGHNSTAVMRSPRLARIEIAPCRSCNFTLYIAVATCARDGDPVGTAKSRLQAAMNKGYESLLREHKQHWAMFWQKSFLRLNGGDDETAAYLENLWYLNLYHQAACSRGFDAPLSNGGLWLNDGDTRSGPAIYRGEDMRASLASLLASNHLELSVPTVDTYYRLLPNVAAQTGRRYGIGGACFPARFNRFGQECVEWKTPPVTPDEMVNRPQWQAAGAIVELPPEPASVDLGDGLYTALLIWQAWRYAPDPFFLRERAYPLLRACTTFALEHAMLAAAQPGLDTEARAALGSALQALLWASKELDLDADLREEWQAGLHWLGGDVPPYEPGGILPLGRLRPEEAAERLRAWIHRLPQRVQGWFAPDPHTPDALLANQVAAAISGLLMREDAINPTLAAMLGAPQANDGFGGVSPGVLQVFPSLPPTWEAAFSLAAPGGFRICGEAAAGKARYVAIRSLLGGVCHIANPWGAGTPVRLVDGRHVIRTSDAAVLSIETQRGSVYVIERTASPLSPAVRARLRGRRNETCKMLGYHRIGLPNRN